MVGYRRGARAAVVVLATAGLLAACGGSNPASPAKDAAHDTFQGAGGGADGGGIGGAGGGRADGGGAVDTGSDAFVPHQFVPGPYNHALVPGGGYASSSIYKVIVTTGQSPGGGNSVKRSSRFRFVGGLIGSTQK
jgi:hypothetical protein